MPGPADNLYPNGPKTNLGPERDPDYVPDYDYEGLEKHVNKHPPSYKLPKVTIDARGYKVVEDMKLPEKGKNFETYYKQLQDTKEKHKLDTGDKILLHDEEGHQFWHSVDPDYDLGVGVWFPPKQEPMM